MDIFLKGCAVVLVALILNFSVSKGWKEAGVLLTLVVICMSCRISVTCRFADQKYPEGIRPGRRSAQRSFKNRWNRICYSDRRTDLQ